MKSACAAIEDHQQNRESQSENAVRERGAEAKEALETVPIERNSAVFTPTSPACLSNITKLIYGSTP